MKKDVFIETSRVQAFREAASVVADTVKGQPGFMLAWGIAGRGKTVCAKEYAVRTASLYIRAYEDWTPRAMLARICQELNGMQPGTVERAKAVIEEELDRSSRTILLDEADRITIKNIEHLRDIHDTTGAPIILIGEPSLYGKLNPHRRLSQRVTRVVEFGPVVAEDVVIFGVKACGLKVDPEASMMLVKRSEGSFRLLYHLMRDLEIIAKSNGTTAITPDLVGMIPDRRITPKPEKEKP